MKIFKHLSRDKTGFISMPFVVLCLAMSVAIMGMVTTFQNMHTIRQLEAVADLAAVEALRANVDEQELRQENLVIQDPQKVRDIFIRKIRETVAEDLPAVKQVEIPSEAGSTTHFSTDSSNWIQSYNSATNTVRYDCGTFSLVEDTSGIATSGTHSTWSFFLDSDIVMFYDTMSLMNRLSYHFLSYTDIFDDREIVISTVQDGNDNSKIAVTIQAIGKVTLK